MKLPEYIKLVRKIGIPDVLEGKPTTQVNQESTNLAKLNKIGLIYSNAIGNTPEEFTNRYQLLIKTLAEVGNLLNSNGIAYCVFKTVKPFPTTPSDVDILVDNKAQIDNAASLLTSSGYRRTADDEYSITLEREMIVDLQLQPSVSNLPYLSRRILMQNATLRNVQGVDIRTLNDEAEIIVTACHSFYKEQMLTLSDYYTITILSERVNSDSLIELAKRMNALEALGIIFNLCAQITKSAFETKALKVNRISEVLGSSYAPLIYDMPFKFPFSLIVKLLISRASKDEDMRRMMMPALIRIASPSQLKKLVLHLTRKTY